MKKVRKGTDVASMAEAAKQAYAEGQDDELFEPIVAVTPEGEPYGKIGEGDCVVFYNIRGEREVQLTQAIMEPDFPHFDRPKGLPCRMATMIEYDKSLPVRVAFPPLERVDGSVGEVVSRAGLRQARIVESEKAIHLSYFFNGKLTEAFPGEDRLIVPSSKDVVNFDEMPEMSIDAVAGAIVEALRDGSQAFLVGNFANVDVVGHMESAEAVRTAVHAVDSHARQVVEEARRQGYATVITADHGTVEKRFYPDGAIDTGHSDSPVPVFVIPPEGKDPLPLREGGSLVDVAPTVLDLLGLDRPEEMTGRSLIRNGDGAVNTADLFPGEPRVLLLILDGWGYLPTDEGNLIAQSETPFVDELMKRYPWVTIEAAGLAVGMPAGSVGNSECGHLHMGAGRVVPSDRVRIDEAIRTGTFHQNPTFRWAMEPAVREGKTLHLLGIVSFYSSHGSLDHLYALMEMAKQEGVQKMFIHSLLGRRGERPESGSIYIDKVEQKAREIGLGEVVTVMGRYWAMDREHNWDRIEKAYRALAG